MNKLLTFTLAALLCASSSALAEPAKSSKATTDTTATQAQSKHKTNIVNINTATSEQLQTLPGIGPKKAEAIIRYRLEHTGFERVGQITLVPGIGDKLAQKLEGKITI